ncbi:MULTISPECIES: hypothetical protein [unclassified Ensifer]|uniref:hypothetical protein n=1 Tax=unclassified Ensifer TaxID=2633371 RepID=UPI000AE67A60|nr:MULTISPECIES: hypothetical protein [unclassified Ensifer]
MMHAEQRLYESRRDVRESKKRQLERRVQQLNDEIRGMEAERTASSRERILIKEELGRYTFLHDKGLMEKSRLSTLERQATDIDGEMGRLLAGVAGVHEKIAETSLQSFRLTSNGRKRSERTCVKWMPGSASMSSARLRPKIS